MKIMVALDGSKFAEAVIGPAAKLAKDAKAEVFLVQVVELSQVRSTQSGGAEMAAEAVRAEYTPEGVHLPDAGPVTPPPMAESFGQALDRVAQTARDYLRTLAGKFAPIKPELVALVGDDVDAELAKFARQRNVDMIAMASHGRTGMSRVVLGSHAAKMVGQRIAPVMIIRPEGLS
ncbi:MAG: universal stress protein [SAR202 cluster bacterium]|nr:universal stress protein [SAR202 cluster bacterium]